MRGIYDSGYLDGTAEATDNKLSHFRYFFGNDGIAIWLGALDSFRKRKEDGFTASDFGFPGKKTMLAALNQTSRAWDGNWDIGEGIPYDWENIDKTLTPGYVMTAIQACQSTYEVDKHGNSLCYAGDSKRPGGLIGSGLNQVLHVVITPDNDDSTIVNMADWIFSFDQQNYAGRNRP